MGLHSKGGAPSLACKYQTKVKVTDNDKNALAYQDSAITMTKYYTARPLSVKTKGEVTQSNKDTLAYKASAIIMTKYYTARPLSVILNVIFL